VLRYTRLGRDIYALGSNSESARLAGIRVRRVQLIPFLLNGALVGLAGVIFAGRFGTVQPNTGQGFELIVIAAVVVGGANIFGGSGASAGTVLGALLVSVMGTLLIFFSVNAFWEEAVQGGIILFSVAYYTIRQNRTVVRGITTSATSDSSRRE
jgi:ribose/xylose/arabinose/galactoside ABC-type transport system permease subunit